MLTYYHNLIAHAKSLYANTRLSKDEFSKHLSSSGLSAHAPIFYVVDYAQRKYLYVGTSCKTLLGYDIDYLVNAGPDYYARLLHKNDYKVFITTIRPAIIQFLKPQSPAGQLDFLFSFNYRVQAKNGTYCIMLQRSAYLLNVENNALLAASGFVTDISNFKDDTKMIYTVEKADSDFNVPATGLLLKNIYFPDKEDELLSRRETEILRCIYDGLSSKEIADKLFISINTINNHRKHMLEKTKCKNGVELLNYALKHSLL